MKITSNIFLLSGSAFSAVGNSDAIGDVYGVVSDKGIILIDCGKSKYGFETIKETLSSWGIKKRITHCILTHAHVDHCGNAKRFQDEGAIIIVGKEDYDYCTKGGPENEITPYYEEQCFSCFRPDIVIDKDEKLEINGVNFELLKTPGHTRGSLSVRISSDEKYILFTGDILQPDGMKLDSCNFGWKGDPYYNPNEIYKSIKKLSMYKTDVILPGHGNICLKNGDVLLKHALKKAYLLNR
jgi:glyoxylase-like metal-dependent hydrolase (beta-lactamase superfamily II)